jgi:hypothetical protein
MDKKIASLGIILVALVVVFIIGFIGEPRINEPKLCGDDICDPSLEEDAFNCYHDCGECGDGICGILEDYEGACPEDCYCGDSYCDYLDENNTNCPEDCETGRL